MQSIILLYIKETDGRPADGAIQSRIGWEERTIVLCRKQTEI